jgi:hypothetical protein
MSFVWLKLRYMDECYNYGMFLMSIIPGNVLERTELVYW